MTNRSQNPELGRALNGGGTAENQEKTVTEMLSEFHLDEALPQRAEQSRRILAAARALAAVCVLPFRDVATNTGDDDISTEVVRDELKMDENEMTEEQIDRELAMLNFENRENFTRLEEAFRRGKVSEEQWNNVKIAFEEYGNFISECQTAEPSGIVGGESDL